MTFRTLIVFIVCFSRIESAQIEKIPRLPSAKINEHGHAGWEIMPRIVGGRAAKAGEFQGMISIQTSFFEHFCGGSLIHASHILTAAHCVTEENGAVLDPMLYQLVGDDLILKPPTITRQTRSASHVFVHQQYDAKYLLNDIAVIRVDHPFIVSFTFSPISRVTSTPPVGYSCSVAGWGSTYYTGRGTNSLQRVNVSIIDRFICNSTKSYNGFIRDGMICAGNIAGGQDACQGDSGGGLICEDRLAGVVSWGYQCGKALFPGVYTDVVIFNDWIESTITWNGGWHANVPTPTTRAPSRAGAMYFSTNLAVVSFLALLA